MVEGVGGVEIPDAEPGCVLVGVVVGLRLKAPVQVDIQRIVPPGMMVVGSEGGGVADAAVEHFPFAGLFGPGIGVGVVG